MHNVIPTPVGYRQAGDLLQRLWGDQGGYSPTRPRQHWQAGVQTSLTARRVRECVTGDVMPYSVFAINCRLQLPMPRLATTRTVCCRAPVFITLQYCPLWIPNTTGNVHTRNSVALSRNHPCSGNAKTPSLCLSSATFSAAVTTQYRSARRDQFYGGSMSLWSIKRI
jgi:hypothetical protein